ncbi:Type 1 phosphatases regulator ypi1 [Lecanicillium sp. MT-2017a]|nr:Type 1 phosphatases regulator ypi1 [Lecanicillium sp. MT-2017a]
MSQGASQRTDPTPSTTQTTVSFDSQHSTEPAPTILRLRGRHTSTGRSVQWAEDVVDNEGLGRKSSKVCCIYHKPKAAGESSDESSSDSSDSDSEDDRRRAKHSHDGDKDGHACGHSHGRRRGKARQNGERKKRAPSPNAYEKVPKQKPKDTTQKKS